MLAARMVQTFDLTGMHITQRVRFEDGDWDVGRPVAFASQSMEGKVDIIDLNGAVKTIVHPGNASDCGESTLENSKSERDLAEGAT